MTDVLQLLEPIFKIKTDRYWEEKDKYDKVGYNIVDDSEFFLHITQGFFVLILPYKYSIFLNTLIDDNI